MTLEDFVQHPVAVAAKLSQAEVAVLRLYTGKLIRIYRYYVWYILYIKNKSVYDCNKGPLYLPWNTALREYTTNPEKLASWGTCIAVLYNAIFKLSISNNKMKATVYRGVNESVRVLPQEFVGMWTILYISIKIVRN